VKTGVGTLVAFFIKCRDDLMDKSEKGSGLLFPNLIPFFLDLVTSGKSDGRYNEWWESVTDTIASITKLLSCS
jgi:hypothetical protein